MLGVYIWLIRDCLPGSNAFLISYNWSIVLDDQPKIKSRYYNALRSCSGNNRCCYLLDLQENKEDLNNALVELRATRDGVKKRVDEAENNPNHKCTPEVDSWLKRVQTIDDEVVQVIQKADQEIQGRCFGGNCPKNCWSSRKIGKLVLRMLPIVNDLRSKRDLFVDVVYRLPPPLVQREPLDLTVGMESMFDKVWRLLDQDEVRIMGLYGYSGVGKTTLLKQINNEFLKTTTTTTSSSSSLLLHGFDVVILVVVSKVINIDAIQKEIGKRLGLSSTEADKTSIFNALSKKNFVLLLDDLWEGVDLQSIGIPHPPPENNKSKVVFTTRSEAVCGHMDANAKFRVECLLWDKAWALFQEKVGNEILNSHPDVPELAKSVTRECDGLPLALITIGRAMSAKRTPQEWNHAITTLRRSASLFPGMGDIVLPRLKLSYDNLSDDTIKSCFLYCALFPEDHSIRISKLIDYWIGEGLISLSEFDHIDEARNQGHDVIGNLKSVCLLESGGDEETQVKMHDTIRDLALWIAHDCESKRDKMFTIKTSDLTAETSSSSWYNAERICLIPSPPPPHNGETEDVRSPSPLESPNLISLCHSCWLSSLNLSKLPQNFFEFTPLLRVLDLSWSNIETFPMSITELVELRYLNLSWTSIQALPEELGRLVKLNLLDLSYMWGLQKIPSGVIGGSLLELRVLNLFGSSGVVDWDVIDQVYKLKHLNDLGINIYTSSSLTKLLSSSNKNLQMCTRHLLLYINPFLFDLQSEDVKLQSTSTSSSPIITLEKLQLLFNLETLRLLDLPEADQLMMNMVGIQQQQHLGSCCFQNLGDISIWNCNGLKDLTWVGYVPNLKNLFLSNCKELEEIVVIVVVDDLGGGSTTTSAGEGNEIIFKSLITLHLSNLPRLKSICRNALAFPCLKDMEVSNCPRLKKLPFDSGSNVNNTLQRIAGDQEWWNGLRWEEEDHDNNELLKSKFLPHF